MNRHERRAGAPKIGPDTRMVGSAPATSPVLEDAGKSSFMLRVTAWVLLSNFMLKRVRHPQVLRLLMEVARQSGRMDAAQKLQARINDGQ